MSPAQQRVHDWATWKLAFMAGYERASKEHTADMQHMLDDLGAITFELTGDGDGI